MAGVSEKLTSVLMGSLLASAAYLSVAWAGHNGTAALAPSSLLLRLFFTFGVVYAIVPAAALAVGALALADARTALSALMQPAGSAR